KNAENALHYAINLAEKIHAKIILLHAFHIDYPSAYVPVNIIENLVKEAEKKSNEKLSILRNKVSHNKHHIELMSSQDLAVDAILAKAKDYNVDFILMG